MPHTTQQLTFDARKRPEFDYTDVAVLDLLLAVNDRTVHGILYDLNGSGSINNRMEYSLGRMANDVFTAINELGADDDD